MITFTEIEEEFEQRRAEREARDVQLAQERVLLDEIEVKICEFIGAHPEWSRFFRPDRDPDRREWQFYPEPDSWSCNRVYVHRRGYDQDGYSVEASWYSTTLNDLKTLQNFREAFDAMADVVAYATSLLEAHKLG